MKINIIGRKLNVRDSFKELVEKKLEKLDKFFKDDAVAYVTMSKEKNGERLEITVSSGAMLFRAEECDETFNNSLDRAVDTIERQIRKNKTRLRKKLREGLIPDGFTPEIIEAHEEIDVPETIIRKKKFEYTPMSPEEAVMQMNLLGHTFFVFNDADTGKTCVVYTRRDGNYGLIEPEN